MSNMATEVDFDPRQALQTGIEEIKAKQPNIELNRNYYDGIHPRLEWIQKIRKVFGDEVADQVHVANYCQKPVDMPLARMAVTGFDDSAADELFRANGLYQAQEDLYFDAMLANENYVIVADPDEDSDAAWDIVVQRPEDCHVEMGSLKPNDRKFAVKIWADDDLGDEGGYRAQVWDRTDYWRFVSYGDPNSRPIPDAGSFQVDPENETGPHGFEHVPVIPFRRRRHLVNRLDAIRPFQDRIDMLEIEKVIAGLFGASRQRVFFTHQELEDGDTESSPDFAIVLEPGDRENGQASVTEFNYTPLENYDSGIDKEIDRLYEVADLPKHGRTNTGGRVSGETVKAEEGPFTSMIGGWTGSFDESWREVFALMEITTEPTWREIVTRNEQTEAEIVKTLVDSGAPLEWALKYAMDLDEDALKDLRDAMAEKVAAEAEAREQAIQALDQGRPATEIAEEYPL